MSYFNFGVDDQFTIFCNKLMFIEVSKGGSIILHLIGDIKVSQLFSDPIKLNLKLDEINKLINLPYNFKELNNGINNINNNSDKVLVDKDALNTVLICLNDSVKYSRSINPTTASLVLTTYTKLNSPPASSREEVYSDKV